MIINLLALQRMLNSKTLQIQTVQKYKCFLIFGVDTGLVFMTKRRIIALYKKYGYGDIISYSYPEYKNDVHEIYNALLTPTIFNLQPNLHDKSIDCSKSINYSNSTLNKNKNLIILDNCTDDTVNIIQKIVNLAQLPNIFIMISGELKKNSKLRLLAETHNEIYTINCYRQTQSEIENYISQYLNTKNIVYDIQVPKIIVSRLHNDISLISTEIEKLITYSINSTVESAVDSTINSKQADNASSVSLTKINHTNVNNNTNVKYKKAIQISSKETLEIISEDNNTSLNEVCYNLIEQIITQNTILFINYLNNIEVPNNNKFLMIKALQHCCDQLVRFKLLAAERNILLTSITVESPKKIETLYNSHNLQLNLLSLSNLIDVLKIPIFGESRSHFIYLGIKFSLQDIMHLYKKLCQIEIWCKVLFTSTHNNYHPVDFGLMSLIFKDL